MTRAPAPQRILIIRLSAIGDVVFASPLIGALRRTYPSAHLAWLVEPSAARLLRHNPALDEVIVWPRGEWQALWRARRYGELWRALRTFLADIRGRRFDLVLDTQGLLKSALWAWLSGAHERVGLGSKEGSQYLMTRVVSRRGGDDGGKRIGSEYLRLARTLGLDVGEFAMDIALNAEDEQFARDFAARTGPYAVLCPFTTRPQKHWVEARWPEVARGLEDSFPPPFAGEGGPEENRLKRPKLRAVLLGGPADKEAAARIVAAERPAPASEKEGTGEAWIDRGIVNMTGACSLTRSAALIKHASLLIGVDTGLTHMGIAFNVPTLALFGSTCPYLDTTRTNAKVLYHKLDCSPCRRQPTCEGRFDCMARITVDEVLAQAREVLR